MEDSSQEYDWNKETTQDILGNTFTTMSAPTITQTFDPCNLDAGETALTKLWQLAIKDQDVAALAEQDMMDRALLCRHEGHGDVRRTL